MFSLNQSQNTLNQVKMTVILPPSNITYTGNPRNVTIEVTPPDAVYSIKNAQGSLIKMGRGNSTLHTGYELNMGVNSGASAIYSIHPSGNENYTYVLDNQQSVTGTLTITKAVLTITSNNASMIYGSSVPVFTYTPAGFVNSETAAVITGTVTHTTAGTSSSNVGTYVITPSVLNLSATNYTFSAANGTLTINKATLTATTITGSATYNGASQSVTVIGGVNGTYTGLLTALGTDAGSFTTIISGTGNYTGNVTGTLTINPLAITSVTWSIGSATTSAHNSTAQSVTVSSIAPTGATYSLATTTATDVGSVAKTILTGTVNYSGSFTSPNLTIGAPPAPANFTASVSGTTVNLSWSVVPGCKYFVYRGAGILVAEVSEYSLSTSFAAVDDANYTFYVIAQTLNVPTNSRESRTAIVYTGKAAWYTYPAYTGTYANQSPLCLTGSKSGTIGLKSYVQGSYSITLNTVRVRNLKTNSAFVTGQITSSTRTIAWNVGGTPTFPSGTANPSAGPFTKAVPTSGTVTITLVAGGSGWSTNNTAGVSGIYWAQAEWRWDGYYTQLNAAIPSTVSYI